MPYIKYGIINIYIQAIIWGDFMLITDKNELKKYYTDQRIWQGIPGIEVTKSGRIFSAFYSGGIDEELENFVALLMSDDGVNFGEPIAVVHKLGARCFDECLWIDPRGRLWLFWSQTPNCGTWAVVCDDPDADELKWSDEIFVGHDVMMNKPIVLSSGEWILPIAVWGERVRRWQPERAGEEDDMGSFAYCSRDNGKTFEKLGGVNHPDVAFDEHMIIELNDDRLMMLIRTMKGIGVSFSYDRGVTWVYDEEIDIGLKGPNSRFYIGRLNSGRILLVNHDNFSSSESNPQGRDNLTLFLSEDDGKTWPYKLLIDERTQVSYPDATESDDGYIYVTYDRDRGCGKKSLDEVYSCEREILYAVVTEEDIINGKISSPKGRTKCIISKLGKYNGGVDYFSNPPRHYEFSSYLADKDPNDALRRVFYRVRAERVSMEKNECIELDRLCEEVLSASDNVVKAENLRLILNLFFTANRRDEWIIPAAREAIIDAFPEKLSVSDVAEKICVSVHHMKYCFNATAFISAEKYIDVIYKTESARRA